jgi:hypothetical protein
MLIVTHAAGTSGHDDCIGPLDAPGIQVCLVFCPLKNLFLEASEAMVFI